MSEKIMPGAIVVIRGGSYDGHGAKICKIDSEKQKVEVMIAGRVVKLGFDRVGLKNES